MKDIFTRLHEEQPPSATPEAGDFVLELVARDGPDGPRITVELGGRAPREQVLAALPPNPGERRGLAEGGRKALAEASRYRRRAEGIAQSLMADRRRKYPLEILEADRRRHAPGFTIRSLPPGERAQQLPGLWATREEAERVLRWLGGA